MRVDWSSQGFGYLLFERPPNIGVLVGLNLRGKKNDQANLYLGELQGICWILQDIKRLT